MDDNLKDTFGLRVSNSGLTAVELEYTKKGILVKNFSTVELAPGVVENDYLIIDQDAFKESLKKLLSKGEKGPMKSKNVIISIPERKIFSHYLDIPIEKINDFEFIKEEARDFIPVELDEATTDYKVIESASSNTIKKINFVAAQENFAQSVIEILKEFDLTVVAIDVSNNTLIRACQNEFNENNGAFMIVDVEKYALITVVSSSGISSSIHSKVTKEYQDVLRKTKELIKSVENEEEGKLEIKTIYLVGPGSDETSLKQVFEKNFAEVKVVSELEYIKLGERSAEHARAIGLALRAALPGESDREIDLLPWKKKREVESERITPTIKKITAAITLIAGGILITAGLFTAESKLALDFINQKGKLIFQRANNPELNTIARQTQQEGMLEMQIGDALKDSVPGGFFIREIHNLITPQIDLLAVNYGLDPKGNALLQINARSADRDATTFFIGKLEASPYFTEVDSPLSNLAGKGERNIQISMVIDIPAVTNTFFGGKKEDVPAEVATEEVPTEEVPVEVTPTESSETIPSETIPSETAPTEVEPVINTP